MKRMLSLCLAVLSPTLAFCIEPNIVNKSSFTQTNDTKYIAANFLDKVVVGVATSGGTLEIYNSTWTTQVLVSSITLGTVFTHDFDDTRLRGLYYRTTGNSNGVTIIYK